LGRPAAAQTIFACEPEWAALTHILLPAARLHVATHAGQDPHHIEARPALIAQLRGADAAICTGASLEAGWLPTLQQRAGNPRVQDGAPGLFLAASATTLIDPRPGAGGNPFAGDVHAEGNPHLHADPRRLLEVARAPGLSPTPGHLQRLLEQLRERPPAAVVVSAFQDPRAGHWLARQLGGQVPVLQLPATVEDPEAPDALGRWFDRLVNALVRRG